MQFLYMFCCVLVKALLNQVFIYTYDFFFKLMKLYIPITRVQHQTYTEFRRASNGKFYVNFKGALTWNSLPNDINMFKSKLKEYIQNHHV